MRQIKKKKGDSEGYTDSDRVRYTERDRESKRGKDSEG